MSELLSETYQSGIYWAALNAEQARERDANAELDYWTKRAEKDGLVVRVERTDGPESTEDDGVRAGRKEVQAPPIAPAEQPRICLCGVSEAQHHAILDGHAFAPAPPAQERASDEHKNTLVDIMVGNTWEQSVVAFERALATAAKRAREEALEEAAKLVGKWNFMACSDADGLVADIRALAAQPSPQKKEKL